MLRRFVFLALGAALLSGASACNDSRKMTAQPGGGVAKAAEVIEIGGSLFPVKQLPPVPAPEIVGREPILIAAHLSIVDKIDVPAQRDGRILFIGTEVKANDGSDPKKMFKYRDKVYRVLEPGDRVEPNQVIMLLDDSEAWAQRESARVAADSARKVLEKASKVRESVERIYEKKDLQQRANKAFSEVEMIQSEMEMYRAQATETDQEANYKKAVEEFNRAKINYDFYTIRSAIAGHLQPFNRKPGESVKALETALQVQGTDVLRAEGVVDVGYAGRLKRGMPVVIEPTVEEAPLAVRRFHTQAINGVAIGGHAGKNYIVTVGEDKTAHVWDGRSDHDTAIFVHPVAVRSVACSPAGAPGQYCLTGAEDGKARLWDLSNPKSSRTALREFEGGHKGVISAVAFAPDGRTCATADARDIVMWEVETGKMLYRLPQHHLGEITSLTFTPQAKLVSASRDLTVRVWSLGQNGAALDFTLEGRSGDVGRLGVSHDGRYALLDVTPSLRLINIAEKRNEGVIKAVNDASKFSTLAIFSPDSKFVLTGTQNEGRLSLWRVPTAGNRATELRHLVPRERMVNFTCAAMSPVGEAPFAVTGTRTGETYLWAMPTDKDITRIPGVLKFIDQTAAAATRQIRVWAEFPNDQANLLIGTNATIVVEPK